MFEKDKLKEKYIREEYSIEEELYNKYLELRKSLSRVENIKYDNPDTISLSEEFKQGFIAGVKIMSSLLLDI